MFKSVSSTSNFWFWIRSSASTTSAADVSSKPCACRIEGRVCRMLGSSSTKRIRLCSMTALLVNGYFDDLFLNGVGDELRLVMDIEFAHQVELMRLHRFHAQS